MKIRFLFLMTSFFIASCPLICQGMHAHWEGLDEFFLRSCQDHGRPFNLDLLPSRARGNSRMVVTVRHGNLGERVHPKTPHHPQSIDILSLNFPQDEFVSTLTHLFPCPDGVLLIANQTRDALGQLDFKKMGHLLRLVETNFRNKKELFALKCRLYDFLSCSQNPPLSEKDYKKLLKTSRASYLPSLKKTLSLQAASFLRALSEEDLKELEFFPSDPLILTKCLKVLAPFLFISGLLKSGEAERYVRSLEDPTQISQNPVPRGSLPSLRSREIKVAPEEDEKRNALIGFIEVLVKALTTERSNLSPYPSFLVERATCLFFLQKAKEARDIKEFLAGYLDIKVADLKSPFPQTFFLETTYWGIRNSEALLRENLLNPERANFLSRGYDIFESPLPAPIFYQRAGVNGHTFPDCIENAARYLANIALKERKSKSSSLLTQESLSEEAKAAPAASQEDLEDPSNPAQSPQNSQEPTPHFTTRHLVNLQEDAPLKTYYALINKNPLEMFSKKGRNLWAQHCSHLPGVRYLKKENPEGENTHELTPGIINFLNLMHHLLGNPSPLLPFEENLPAVSESLHTLCRYLSREDLAITWQEDLALSYRSSRQDYFDTLTFIINGKKSFTLTMSFGNPGHGYVTVFPDLEGDWKCTTDIGALQQALPPEILSFFLTPESLPPLLRTRERPQALAYSMDFSSQEMKLSVIKEAHTSSPSLKPLAQNLTDSFFKLDDGDALTHLFKMFIPLLMNTETVSSQKEKNSLILKMLKSRPDLLDCSLDDPSLPADTPPEKRKNNLSFFAIEHHHTDWLKLALPEITSLNLSYVLKTSSFQKFLRHWLPRCRKLTSLFVHGPFLDEDSLKSIRAFSRQSKTLEKLTLGDFAPPPTCFPLLRTFPPLLSVTLENHIHRYAYFSFHSNINWSTVDPSGITNLDLELPLNTSSSQEFFKDWLSHFHTLKSLKISGSSPDEDSLKNILSFSKNSNFLEELVFETFPLTCSPLLSTFPPLLSVTVQNFESPPLA